MGKKGIIWGICFVLFCSNLFSFDVAATETVYAMPTFEYKNGQVFLGYYSTRLSSLVSFPYKNMSSSADVLEPVYEDITDVFTGYYTIWGEYIINSCTEEYKTGYDFIALPNNVVKISSNAFSDTSFEEVLLDREKSCLKYIDDFAFENSSVKTIELPMKLLRLGKGAFRNSRIEDIVFPAGISKLSEFLFENCDNLKTVRFETLSNIEIGTAAFRGSALESIEFPSVAVEIGDEAFRHVSGDMTLTGGVDISLGNYAFADTEVSSFPFSALSSAGNYAFYKSSFSENASFPNLISIGDYCFANVCFQSDLVKFPKLQDIGEGAFYKCQIDSIDFTSAPAREIPLHAFRESEIRKVVLSKNMININNDAFGACSMLEALEGTDNVRFIGDFAFYSTKLSSVKLPSIVTIGAYSFANSLIEKIDLPASISVIGKSAFKNCNLTDVSIDKSNENLYIEPSAFSGTLFDGYLNE